MTIIFILPTFGPSLMMSIRLFLLLFHVLLLSPISHNHFLRLSDETFGLSPLSPFSSATKSLMGRGGRKTNFFESLEIKKILGSSEGN